MLRDEKNIPYKGNITKTHVKCEFQKRSRQEDTHFDTVLHICTLRMYCTIHIGDLFINL